MSKLINKKIIIILGPTSSGKSDIAIKLAKKFDGEIISADSRQIYRGMDVGTGKVPKSKVKSQKSKDIYISHGIPHYMIDTVNPCTNYNVAKFKHQAEKIIKDILGRGKLPIICGGTGFWIQAIVDNVNFPAVKPDWQLRKKLEKYSVEKLFATLKKLDPERAKSVDAKNKVRLIRAIEICKSIKKVPHKKWDVRNEKWDFLQIGVRLQKKKLYENIEKRVKARFKQGMIEEVENLHKAGLSWKKIQSFGLAYYWIPLYLQNKIHPVKSRIAGVPSAQFNRIKKDELIKKVIQAEKNYAKRQMTWFKRDKKIKWLESYKKIESRAVKYLH
jgi:tRNA dimethylallyltransferase